MSHTVVHYLDSDNFGGCEEVVLMLMAGMDRERWRPILFHHAAPGLKRLTDGVTGVGIECRAIPRMSSRSVHTNLACFVRELRAVHPAVFHAHLNWPLGCRHALIGARLARTTAVVATSHLFSPDSRVRFGRIKQIMQTASIDRYIAVSNEVKERLRKDMAVPESKIKVVHNGIRLARFSRQTDPELRRELTQGSGRPIVLTPARLHSQKGHIYLLQAAALVPDALFVLAGEGPERRSLEDVAKGLGLETRVRFLGQREDIPDLLACCDVFVLPSLYEGLPLSVLEAMAAGKPVVATRIGGTAEAVVHGVTGMLVPPENPRELAAAIRTLLADSSLAARLAEAGRARVAERFSSEAMIQGVMATYDEVVRFPRQ